MRLVGVAKKRWEVVAIADKAGLSVKHQLRHLAREGDDVAEAMLATIRQEVPLVGPSKRKEKCRRIGDYVFEFKKPNCRVLWFWDAGYPPVRRRIVCVELLRKVKARVLKQRVRSAEDVRLSYIEAKTNGTLNEPKQGEYDD